MSVIEPSTDSIDFSCPYCGAHASQTWYSVYAKPNQTERRSPFLPAAVEDVELDQTAGSDFVVEAEKWIRRIVAKEIFLAAEGTKLYEVPEVNNVNLSKCYSCKKIALWHHRDLLYPRRRAGAAPNQDLDQDIKNDIEEARTIIEASPRGAAALLRLAVQKLCVQLGESGNKIDVDIQSLVNKGMDPHLQQAFDAVRVIGNEAVHPGELDLRDDRETAITLIDLINIVAQELITNKKTIAAKYARLPAGKLAGIEARAKGAARKSGTE